MESYGLIRGRHELPCQKYIFDESIQNVHDYEGIYNHIMNILKNEIEICVYVTGLTPVTVELVKYCITTNTKLTLMNYDISTRTYIPQVVIS